MADFSFLNNVGMGGDDGESDDEATNTQNQAFERAHKAASENPVYVDLDQDSDATHEFQKKRAKLADFAKNEALSGVEKLAAKRDMNSRRAGVASGGFGAGGIAQPFDYEGIKQQIAGSSPDKYASILQREAQKHVQGTDLDEVLSPVEQAVQNYKRHTIQDQQTQAQQVNQQLSVQDQPGAVARVQQLDEKIKQAQKDLLIAASQRQSDQIKENIKFLQDQRAQQVSKAQSGRPDTMQTVLTAAGWDRQDYIQANAEMRRGALSHGISPEDPVTPGTFPIIVPKLIEEAFSPEVAAKWYQEVLGPQAQQKSDDTKPDSKVVSGDLEKDPRFKDISDRLATSQQQHDALWKELANSGTFNNVGDIIGFVLSSIVLGPRAACALFTNMDRNGNLRHELDLVNHETSQLFHEQNSYIQLSKQAREHAINEEHAKDQFKEAKRHHLEMEGIQYNRLRMLAGKIQDPEMKNIAAARLHGLRIAEANLRSDKENIDRMEKAANNPMDPRFKTAKVGLLQVTKDYAQKVQQMKHYRLELQNWFEKNAQKVGGLLGANAGGGTNLNAQNFSQDDE